MDIEPTPDERRAIATLKRLSKHWPSSLWLFSNGHALYVMRTGSSGERVVTSGSCFDQSYIVESLNIPSDGGDF